MTTQGAAHPDTDAAVAAVQERYRRFARDEAPGRSPLYVEWAQGVASDAHVAAVIAGIPPTHRQPPLVFAVARLLGCGDGGFGSWRRWLLVHAERVRQECQQRSLQTNEPLRCAAMLPALSRIDGPIAVVEVGASAGLCLFPDRYSYRFAHDDSAHDEGTRKKHTVALDPADGPSPVVLHSRWCGPAPRLRMPEIVWRAGIDLQPRDARDPADRAWLEGLVWPGEHGRAERVRAALDVAAASPPLLVAGDAATALPALLAAAPPGVTLVVTTPGVLVHIPRIEREQIVDLARRGGRWVTMDAPGLHSGVHGRWHPVPERDQWRNGAFALALDGEVLAAVDPLGARVAPVAAGLEWRADPDPAPA